MEPVSTLLYQYGAPTDLSLKLAESSKPILSFGCELSPELIAMIKDQSFSKKLMKTPIPIYVSLSRFAHVFTLRACLMKLYDGSIFLSL
jgi:hypothetical protein